MDEPIHAVDASCTKIKFAIEENEKNKLKISYENQKPEAEKKNIIEDYQSKISNLSQELKDLKEKFSPLEVVILNDLKQKLKPATPKEIVDWERGAKESNLETTKIQNFSLYFTEKDIILPPFYGSDLKQIIVAKGVNVLYTKLGHNALYFMDGFRKLGGF